MDGHPRHTISRVSPAGRKRLGRDKAKRGDGRAISTTPRSFTWNFRGPPLKGRRCTTVATYGCTAFPPLVVLPQSPLKQFSASLTYNQSIHTYKSTCILCTYLYVVVLKVKPSEVPSLCPSSDGEKQARAQATDRAAGDCESHNDDDLTAEQQRRIIRRIDRRLIGTVGLLYCVSIIDRTNMSSANIAGMSVELRLQGYRYNLANLVFFITYVVLQPPSTILVRRLGPRVHLSVVVLLWGAVMTGMGFVSNFSQLVGLRALLGVFESGFFPSTVYLLSTWYTRYEVGKRYSAFYLLSCVAASFSGILAFGLMHMGGVAGLGGWRWIFIIEGVATCLLATASYWLLVDFPDSTRSSWRFLSTRERQWIVSRIERDRADSTVTTFQPALFLRAARDWRIWIYALIFFNSTTITYALAYTLPLILVGSMGFSVGAAQCLVAPPYVFAGIVMFISSWLSDRHKLRGPAIVFNMLLCLMGLPMMGWLGTAAGRYAGVFLLTAGANANVPVTLALQANNVRGQWKRAFCSATLVGFGGLGGIAGSLVFRDQDRMTGYRPGLYACVACSLFNIALVALCTWDSRRQNRLADEGRKMLESSEAEPSTEFRYTY
ncbi:hypothetical protein XA68_18294 [Ophiocordyceps unilateralis]|uniref:Major facilitator superfamily (MFS) profile domain-containing protein n=1 Tax=Ophiocordyceps unilateralis TaxID=268505 RepID=A0A2A9PJU3_OPHUN|nr:hypothetical protein XA68_18294 [Ophiocordyceps unilateralis]